ncbi:hypothetical protein K8T06_09130 [bacterium]|nr:hypothetical protein [bacterium]
MLGQMSYFSLVCIMILSTTIATADVEISKIVYSPRITGSHGLLETADGNVYLSDSYSGSDTIYRITSGFPEAVASGFNSPSGMWQSNDGDIFVCDVNASRVYQYSSSWSLETWYSVPNPWTMVLDGSDLVVASYNGNVYRVNDGGTDLIWTGLTDSFGIAIDSNSNLYVSEHTAGRISKRTSSGVVSVLTDELTQPEGIRIGPDGRLWVADTVEGKIYFVSLDGVVEEMDSQGYNLEFAVNLTQLRGNHIYLGCAGSNGRVFQLTWQECLHHGDVNLDGSLTAEDAQLAFLIALGFYTPTFQENCAADCNNDSDVTAADAQLIFLASLGSGSCVDQPPESE